MARRLPTPVCDVPGWCRTSRPRPAGRSRFRAVCAGRAVFQRAAAAVHDVAVHGVSRPRLGTGLAAWTPAATAGQPPDGPSSVPSARTERTPCRRSGRYASAIRLNPLRVGSLTVDQARARIPRPLLFHGWPVARVPRTNPTVTGSRRAATVPRRAPRDGRAVQLAQPRRRRHHRRLGPTLARCAPSSTAAWTCPFAEALAVFDSSWRAGLKPKEIQLAARSLPLATARTRLAGRRGRATLGRPTPSSRCSAAIALTSPACRSNRSSWSATRLLRSRRPAPTTSLTIVIEADSFEFHSSRKALDRDVRRYNGLGGSGLAGAAVHLETGDVRAGAGDRHVGGRRRAASPGTFDRNDTPDSWFRP